MDRDGFVEFVQRTLVERKTKGSRVVTRSQSAEIKICSLSLDWTCERTRQSVVCAAQSMDCPQICILRPYTCDPWIAHEIHGLSHEVRIHGLRSAIRGLCKSILCAQHTGRTSCRKCSKCFYVYLNIRPMRYSTMQI